MDSTSEFGTRIRDPVPNQLLDEAGRARGAREVAGDFEAEGRAPPREVDRDAVTGFTVRSDLIFSRIRSSSRLRERCISLARIRTNGSFLLAGILLRPRVQSRKMADVDSDRPHHYTTSPEACQGTAEPIPDRRRVQSGRLQRQHGPRSRPRQFALRARRRDWGRNCRSGRKTCAGRIVRQRA